MPDTPPPREENACLREELAKMRAELESQVTEWRRLEAVSQQAAQEERQWLAQTLHDTVAQSLTAVYFSAKVLEKKLQGSVPERSAEAADLCEMLHGVVEELHGLTRQLRAGGAGEGDALSFPKSLLTEKLMDSGPDG